MNILETVKLWKLKPVELNYLSLPPPPPLQAPTSALGGREDSGGPSREHSVANRRPGLRVADQSEASPVLARRPVFVRCQWRGSNWWEQIREKSLLWVQKNKCWRKSLLFFRPHYDFFCFHYSKYLLFVAIIKYHRISPVTASVWLPSKQWGNAEYDEG